MQSNSESMPTMLPWWSTTGAPAMRASTSFATASITSMSGFRVTRLAAIQSFTSTDLKGMRLLPLRAVPSGAGFAFLAPALAPVGAELAAAAAVQPAAAAADRFAPGHHADGHCQHRDQDDQEAHERHQYR